MTVKHSSQILLVDTSDGPKQLAFQQWQSPTSQKVLFCVHGLTHHSRYFDSLAQALAPDYLVICPDIPGRGDSDWLDTPAHYGYPLYLHIIQQLWEHLKANHSYQYCDWVGTSMGGLMGMLWAAQPDCPIHALVLNDVSCDIPEAALLRIAEYVGQAPEFESVDNAETYLRQLGSAYGYITDAQWRTLTEHSIRKTPNNTWRLKYDPAITDAFRNIDGNIDLRTVWQQVHCQTLLIRGGDSDLLTKTVYQEMCDVNHVQGQIFAGIGHAPLLMNSEQIQVIQNFLSKNA